MYHATRVVRVRLNTKGPTDDDAADPVPHANHPADRQPQRRRADRPAVQGLQPAVQLRRVTYPHNLRPYPRCIMNATERTARRNAASLMLLAPLALPLIDMVCALYVIVARQVARIVNVIKADAEARRNLAAHRRNAMTTQHNLLTAPIMTAGLPVARIVYDVAAPLLDVSHVVTPMPAGELVYTSAACKPIPAAGRSTWLPMQGLRLFAVKVDHVEQPITPNVDLSPVAPTMPATGEASEFAAWSADVNDDNVKGTSSSNQQPNVDRQCMATTKQGKRCTRKGTSTAGCFCTQHAKAN